MLTPLIATFWLACSGGDAPAPAPSPGPVPAEGEPFTYEPEPERHPVRVPTPAMESFALSPRLPQGFPDLRTTGARQFALHTMEGRYDLSQVKRAKGTDAVDEVFVLEHHEVPNPKKAQRALTMVQAPLPFPVRGDQATFRPDDLRVFVGNQELPFTKSPAPTARKSTWRITGKNLVITHDTVPAPGTVRVVYPGVQHTLDRRDPATAGLSDAEFVQGSMTVARHTRHGLVLPAPSSAEWDITVPPEGRFRTWLAMQEPPLTKPRGDGADVVLSVIVDGQATEVSRQKLTGKQRDYVRWDADLSPWAGQAVTVRLSTEPHRNHAFDWVFLGSPTVWGAPTADVRRVVVVGLDTTRYDHLSVNGYERGSTPELDAFHRSGVVFASAWTPAPRTRPSFRAATTGRRPLEAVGAPNIAEVFQREGFATAGIVANPHLQPRFDFDQGFDTWTFDGRADAGGQVDDALSWLEEQKHRDTYLFLHFMDAHMIYDAPGEWRNKYADPAGAELPERVKRGEVLSMMRKGALTEPQKVQLEALHDGEMAYMSHELGRFFDALDAMPGKTLVLIHSDRGEDGQGDGVHGRGLSRGHPVTDVEVLRDGLPTRRDTMFHGQAATKREEGLTLLR